MSDRKEPVTVFCADLDNTLIYSRRHDIGEKKTGVEVYEGRVVSFMTERTFSLLKKVRESAELVPTTTRTKEQYSRIDLKTGPLNYALVCNGGVLLRKDQEIPGWYEESLRLIEKSRGELALANICMQKDRERIFEVRNIRDLFLFTKSRAPLQSVRWMREQLDQKLVQVYCNGSKVYVLPVGLDKGTAVKRFQNYIKADRVLAAGDSEFDIPMLKAADRSYAPEELMGNCSFGAHVEVIPRGQVFSDGLLEKVLHELSGKKHAGQFKNEIM